MENKISVIAEPSEKNPFAVIYKPRGLPSAPLKEGEENNALYQSESLFPQVREVKGKKEIEHGLIHRIDTMTDGLLLIATTQEAYDFFIELQNENRFIKYYKAQCTLIEDFYNKMQGFTESSTYAKIKNLKNDEKLSVTVKSLFRPFGQGRTQVRPVNSASNTAAIKKAGSKEYSTEITFIKCSNLLNAECKITNGYRHQVRCHLASCGTPVKGDPLYNPEVCENEEFKFSATGLVFNHPVTKEEISFYL